MASLFGSTVFKSIAMNNNQIQQLTKEYLSVFSNEANRLLAFCNYLLRNSDGNLFARSNFDGHITTSAFILNHQCDSLLLLEHKSLKKWLQPGGHVEGDVSLVASALREVKEETGIDPEMLQLVPLLHDVPFDIDSHYIPPNPRKQEDGHYHHDVRFLFRFLGEEGSIVHSEEEATAIRWFSFAELKDSPLFAAMVDKIQRTDFRQ